MAKPVPVCNYNKYQSRFALICSAFILDAALACIVGKKRLQQKYPNLDIFAVIHDNLINNFNDKNCLSYSNFNNIRHEFGGKREFEISPDNKDDIIEFFNNCNIIKTKQLNSVDNKKIIYTDNKPNISIFKNASLEKVDKNILNSSIINNDALITNCLNSALLCLHYEKELYWNGENNKFLKTFHNF